MEDRTMGEDKVWVASTSGEDPLLTPLTWGYKNTAKQQTSVPVLLNRCLPAFYFPLAH